MSKMDVETGECLMRQKACKKMSACNEMFGWNKSGM